MSFCREKSSSGELRPDYESHRKVSLVNTLMSLDKDTPCCAVEAFETTDKRPLAHDKRLEAVD